MSVGLSLQDDGGGQALVAHTLREGSVVWTVVVHFVRELRERNAVLAFLVRLVLALALLFYLSQVMLKAFMLHIPTWVLALYAVHTSLPWRVVA